MKRNVMSFLLISSLLSSCVIVRQGEVAMKRSLGKLVEELITESAKLHNPFTPAILKFEAIEAFKQLSRSPNAKVIITNGDTPLMIDGDTAD